MKLRVLEIIENSFLESMAYSEKITEDKYSQN